MYFQTPSGGLAVINFVSLSSMKLRNRLIRFYWISNMQFGLDPIKFFRALYSLPRYVRDYFKFSKRYQGAIEVMPCLHDWYEEGRATTSEYFWQDLLVARLVAESNPQKHIDVGSRVDGFVTHVASFREIEVFDIRPITTKIPGIVFKQLDFMNISSAYGQDTYCDSLSCLHALEHFGLGRYGDSIDPKGFETGIVNMASLLKPGGIFYLSVPVGIERVEFNANRVFDPRKIIELAKQNALQLHSLINIKQNGDRFNLSPSETDLAEIADERYSLAIFQFVKN